MKTVPIANSSETIVVDDRDYELVNSQRWFFKYGKDSQFKHVSCFVMRGRRKISVGIGPFIMKPRRGFLVDHVSHDALDNRRCNLRVVTPSQNQMNKSGSRFKKHSRWKGVTKDAAGWIARIKKDGKSKFLGRFDTAREAAKAYNDAATAQFGEFALLNNL